tara:strand:- start:311 stop:829 length:519 start_codon:yes stop_codon:yes gene_type:complete
MANATKQQTENLERNIEHLVANLFQEARKRNKNMMVVEPGFKSGTRFVTLRVYLLKDWYPSRHPEIHDETIIFREGSFDQSFLQMAMRIMILCREFDALTDNHMNSIELPFMQADGFEESAQPDVSDLTTVPEERHQESLSALEAAIELLNGPARDDFNLNDFLHQMIYGEA